MAGTDFNNIYVDLGSTGAEGDLDIHGAMKCNPSSPAGTMDNPLNFDQLRKYFQYRLTENATGKFRQFYITGEYTGVVNYNSGNAKTGVFNIQYDSWDPKLVDSKAKGVGGFVEGYTVEILSWVDDQPYSLNISATTSLSNDISKYGAYNPPLQLFNTYDIKLYISNMVVNAKSYTDASQTKDMGAITFYNEAPPRSGGSDGTISEEKYNNQIALVNCTLISNGHGYISYGTGSKKKDLTDVSVYIGRYTDVLVSNCILYSKSTSGILAIQDKMPDGHNSVDTVRYNYFVYNTIFLNIRRLYRLTDSYKYKNQYTFDLVKENGKNYRHIVDGCVMSSSIQQYFNNEGGNGDWLKLNFMLGSKSTHMQYNFSVPTIPWATAILEDFNYLKYGWQNITERGLLISPIYAESSYPYTANTFVFGVRDGVGSLYYPEMPEPSVSVTPKNVPISGVVTCNNAIPNYDTEYSPSLYEWIVNGKSESLQPTSQFLYTVNDYGETEFVLSVFSHNNWYIRTGVNYTNTVVSSSSVSISIETFRSDGTPSTTFAVNEEVVYIIRNTTYNPIQTIQSVQVDINGTTQTINIPTFGSKYQATTIYNKIGDATILCNVKTMDNQQKYFSKRLNITDMVSKTYYVDLSKEYEEGQKWKLKYVIYDDFEDQEITPALATDFKNKYHVAKMYDEYVATCPTGTPEAIMCRGIKQSTFFVEWSFVRDTIMAIPTMTLTVDANRYVISWDYLSDSLKISGSLTQRIRYGNFVKDLSCPNALHKINVRFSYNPSTRLLELYYSTNGKTWINSGFSVIISTFSSVQVSTQNTIHTGIGYIHIEADIVNEDEFGNGLDGVFVKGSENYPLTYFEMYDRIKLGGTGVFADIYKCKNWRQTPNSVFTVDSQKQFEINVWNADKYGPWMLRFVNAVDLSGTTLLNGIMYNVPSGTLNNLLITTTYNMFIVWNDSYKKGNKIVFVRSSNRFTGIDKRSDIIGSTINSISGFATLEGN